MVDALIDGVRLEYLEDGRGDPLLFVHGSASDYRTWCFQKDEFVKDFRVIVYSRRYHWPNDPIPPGADYSMAAHVDDLQRLIQEFKIEPIHLVGHSYGAFLCLLLAIRAPDVLRTLVLIEPPVITLFVSHPPKITEILKLLIKAPRTAAAILKFGARGAAPAAKAFQKGDMEAGIQIFGDAVFGPGGYDRLSAARKAQVYDNLSNIKAELLGSGFADLDAEQVKRIQIPMLLVDGQKSVALFHLLNDKLEELLPNTVRAEIPGAGHLVHEDNAGAFNAAVRAFLANHRAVG